ncbi:MAG: hypothetical protein JST21_03005 [Bacteroidetes bacterium]|nr:hypothetical protein [Bacteroidota bacterium]
MLKKINRQEALSKYPVFPLRSYDKASDEETITYPKIYKSYVLTLASKSFRGHCKNLGKEISGLAKQLDCKSLIFLGDTTLSWLYQHNDYNPAQRARQYFTDNKIGIHFNGALQPGNDELPIFIVHLSWMIRCNAALPYIYFIDEGQNILGNICKYGNLHIDTLNPVTDKAFTKAVRQLNFQYLNSNHCFNQFSKTSIITGRSLL